MTNETMYCPKPGSLPWRVLAFLYQNPDEELTRHDVSVKFDCNSASVDTQLGIAVSRGILKRTRNKAMELVWSLGGNLNVALGQAGLSAATEAASASPAPAPAPAAAMMSGRPPAIVVVLDPSTIPVRKGVRLLTPEQKRRAEFIEWFDQFEVGDSAEFDDKHLATIRAESKRHAKAKDRTYKIAATGPGRAGVERTA